MKKKKGGRARGRKEGREEGKKAALPGSLMGLANHGCFVPQHVTREIPAGSKYYLGYHLSYF